MKIVTVEEMRRIERECADNGLPPGTLMDNAGKAFAEATARLLCGARGRALVLVGPGNNGGDGLVAARHFYDTGAEVTVYLVTARQADANLGQARRRGITVVEAAGDDGFRRLSEALTAADFVVDAVFGTGKTRAIEGVTRSVLAVVAGARRENSGLRVIALDLPSGLNADTGAVDPAALPADYTVTLGFPKPGLFLFPGADYTGQLSVVDIGIPARLAGDIKLEMMTAEWARTALPPRPRGANKGTFGRVLVAAGSINYIGAAYLACQGAVRAGAGLVTLATAAGLQPVLAAKLTEVTYLPLPEARPGIVAAEAASVLEKEAARYDVLLAGCGLGQSDEVIGFIRALLSFKGLPKLVLDADALNTLARSPSWKGLEQDAILTPHPGEMARLAGTSVEAVQADRPGITRKLAVEWRQTVVLKGAYTVIAAPDGRTRLNPAANPGLASAGTGDVLAGIIAGLAAQGLALYDAASLGVYLHGRAGEAVRDEMGDTGMTASDLLPVIPRMIKAIRENTEGSGICC
ncbi:MAG: NAD(P)H-hydrate dehydratase [Chloroflexi bacterium]|nr:NAD(P)H-hydrate dehydratase [Chloroflexota bacterium]